MAKEKGWWRRDIRIHYRSSPGGGAMHTTADNDTEPLLILGKTGTLGNSFARICKHRNIPYKLLGRVDADLTKPETIEKIIEQYEPWAIINAAGYVRVDDAENDSDNCFQCNATGPLHLAKYCSKYNIRLVSFSSDLVFDGKKMSPYFENDPVCPLNVYGRSKVQAEQYIQESYPHALIIRTSAFFSRWDKYNFITVALESFKERQSFIAAKDVLVSPTYIPDLINASLDLLIDKERGIWHLVNDGEITWAELAMEAAKKTGSNSLVDARPLHEMHLTAKRPYYSVLKTAKGIRLPSLDNALERYFNETGFTLSETRAELIVQ